MVEVAVLGGGRMGGAMARRLLAAGHQVTVWNRGRGGRRARGATGGPLRLGDDGACAAGLEACDMAELSRFLGSEAVAAASAISSRR